MRSIILASILAVQALTKITEADYFYNHTRPLVIAHRGASG